MSALWLAVALAVSPEVGVGFAMTPQSLTVNGVTSVRAPSGVTSVEVGLSYTLAERVWLHSQVGAGLGSLDAHLLLGAQQQLAYRLPVTPWLSLEGGLSVGATLDVTLPVFSFADVGLLLGVRLWRVDVLWLPAVQVPLGRTGPTTAGLTRGMALTVAPLAFAVRFGF
jgi:hypothetical protein